MDPRASEVDRLLDEARRGDGVARQRLLDLHRDKLRRMIGFHLDPRLAARVDPSDVVQEALAEADRKLDDYLRDRPIPFYPWLHRLAKEKLIQAHRHHVGYRRRSIEREVSRGEDGSAGPVEQLVERLISNETSPSGHLLRAELIERMYGALDGLKDKDREVLVMCYLEQLSFREIAAILGLNEGAVKVRHFRALDRLRVAMASESDGEGR